MLARSAIMIPATLRRGMTTVRVLHSSLSVSKRAARPVRPPPPPPPAAPRETRARLAALSRSHPTARPPFLGCHQDAPARRAARRPPPLAVRNEQRVRSPPWRVAHADPPPRLRFFARDARRSHLAIYKFRVNMITSVIFRGASRLTEPRE